MNEQEKQPSQQAGEEQQIIDKLEAQKNTVRPSPQLLSNILAQLPAIEEQKQHNSFYQNMQTFSWIRLAIPAGALLLVGGIFFATSLSNAPLPNDSPEQNEIALAPAAELAPTVSSQAPTQALIAQVTTEKALSLASIDTEEQTIEDPMSFEEFFEDDLQMQEIDAALAEF